MLEVGGVRIACSSSRDDRDSIVGQYSDSRAGRGPSTNPTGVGTNTAIALCELSEQTVVCIDSRAGRAALAGETVCGQSVMASEEWPCFRLRL